MNPLRFAMLLTLLYAALLADTLFAAELAVAGVSPDWCALLLIVWLLHAHSPRTVLIGALLGLLSDLGTAGRVGPGAIAFSIASYFVPWLAAKLPTRLVAVEAATVGAATLGVGLMLSAMARITGELEAFSAAWLVEMCSTAAYTAFVSVPILMLVHWILGDSASWRWRHAT